jgi:hypothetical protein
MDEKNNVTPLPTQPRPKVKLCPLLTMAIQEPQVEARIALLPGAMPEAPSMEVRACLGDQCAFFVGMADETGKIVNGGCAPTVMTIQLAQGTAVLAQMMNDYQLRRKS